MAVNLLRFQFPGLPCVRCAFQKRSHDEAYSLAGNISLNAGQKDRTLQTREQLLHSLQEAGLAAWAECRQTHGDRIVAEPVPADIDCDLAKLPEADGMMTRTPGLGLMIKTADCQPILLAHKSGKYIMAIHAGWRGNRLNFPGTAASAFCRHYNVKPSDIMAVRGPSLGPAASEFVNFAEEWGDGWRQWYDESSRVLNLWSLARCQLNEAGIPHNQIYELDICTFLNYREFFSWRREKTAGRQASIIWIDKELS